MAPPVKTRITEMAHQFGSFYISSYLIWDISKWHIQLICKRYMPFRFEKFSSLEQILSIIFQDKKNNQGLLSF